MENKPHTVDPAADLAMLDRAKSSVDINQALDFGPWWYAPLFAAMLGSVSLFSDPAGGNWRIVYLVVGLTTGVGLSVHDYRRRKVRQKRSVRTFMIAFPIALGAVALVAAWGTALSALGYERFVPGYAVVAWLITTAAMLGLRAVLHSRRAQQSELR